MTRYLVVVKHQAAVKLAQYGLCGGHPREAGETVLEFARAYLSSRMGREKFALQLARVRLLSSDDARKLEKDLSDQLPRFTPDWHEQVKARYPGLDSTLGADVLRLVLEAKETFVAEDSTEMEDPLWFYTIDLDREALEVTGGYVDTEIVHDWSLNALPSSSAFLAELRDPDEDDEYGVN